MAQQLTFDLSHRPALQREDFLVAASNQAAVALVDLWPHWSSPVAAIVGDHGSGKTHLANVWQQRSGAVRIEANRLSEQVLAEVFAVPNIVVEDIDPRAVPETELFHLFNLARQRSGSVLLTSVADPTQWHVSLPDLASRLKAITVAQIQQADDALLRGLLVKHFADRQLAVDEAVVSYIVKRMPRSMAAVAQIVGQIDAQALAEGAEVTRSFVTKTLQSWPVDED